MAMNKGLKVALILAGVGVTGTIAYFIYKKWKENKEDEESKDRGDVTEDQVKTAEYNARPKGSEPKGTLPFTNKTEGNAFRKWINDTYPKYAEKIDLDATGSYNNAFIRKAYEKYGAEYLKDTSGYIGTKNVFGGLTKFMTYQVSHWNKPLTYRKDGNAYMSYKFKNTHKKCVSGCKGVGYCINWVYFFNHSTAYQEGKSNDARSVIEVRIKMSKPVSTKGWDAQGSVAEMYVSFNGSTYSLEGTSNAKLPNGQTNRAFGKKQTGITSLGVAIGQMSGMTKFNWC